MRISDWSSDVCSSDLPTGLVFATPAGEAKIEQHRASVAEQGDRAGIAQPGVVVGALHKSQPWRSSELAEHATGMGLHRVVGYADAHRLQDRKSGGEGTSD